MYVSCFVIFGVVSVDGLCVTGMDLVIACGFGENKCVRNLWVIIVAY